MLSALTRPCRCLRRSHPGLRAATPTCRRPLTRLPDPLAGRRGGFRGMRSPQAISARRALPARCALGPVRCFAVDALPFRSRVTAIPFKSRLSRVSARTLATPFHPPPKPQPNWIHSPHLRLGCRLCRCLHCPLLLRLRCRLFRRLRRQLLRRLCRHLLRRLCRLLLRRLHR